MPAPYGTCSICGLERKLSFEHVPPEAAFNDAPQLVADLKHYFNETDLSDIAKMRMRKSRRGAGRYTLCERCNNDTGSWYVPAYVGWAHQGMRYMRAQREGGLIALPFQVFPGRIAKQIFAMFASVCGPKFFAKNPELRKYVLDRHSVGIPERFDLYSFIVNPKSAKTRQAGITGLLSGTQKHVFAEISFPPFGYILTIDSEPNDKKLNRITYFTHHGYGDYRELNIKMPIREIHSYFPGDFRTKEEWDSALIQDGAE